MGFFSTICPSCGRKISKSARFCPHCQADPQAGWRLCTKCWNVNKAAAKFCTRCGASLTGTPAGVPVGQVWNRGPDDFARRFELPDFKGAFKNGFYVATGTRAMLLVDGKYIQSLPPGLYTPESPSREKILWNNFPQHATVIAVDAGDTELYLTFPGLPSKENMKVETTLRLVLRISDESAFFVNRMKDLEEITIDDLLAFIYPEAKNAMAECVAKHNAADLKGDLALKKEFETAMELHLSQTLGRIGLAFVQVRTLECDYELRDEEVKLATYKKRVELWDKMRQAVNSDRMNKVTTEEEFAKFIHEVDKEKLLREEEMEELKRAFAEKKEDHELARRFLTEKLTLEHKLEMQRLNIVANKERFLHKIEKVKIALELKLKKAEMKDKEERLRIDREHEEKQKEIERAQELSRVSTEVLITMTDSEKAQIIADLAKTKILKDLDEDEILAMGAADKPDSQLALAFAEKFKALQEGKLVDMQKEMYEKFFKQLSEANKQALEMMRDVAKSAAESGKPNVVYPPGGSK